MKLLVCTDGSTHSREAAEKAAEFAKFYEKNVQVTVLHVHKALTHEHKQLIETTSNTENRTKIEKKSEEQAKAILDETAKIFEERGISVKKELKKGSPAGKILEFTKNEDFDMIILGHRGKGGFLKKMILGSVSNAIVQETNSDVWIVK